MFWLIFPVTDGDTGAAMAVPAETVCEGGQTVPAVEKIERVFSIIDQMKKDRDTVRAPLVVRALKGSIALMWAEVIKGWKSGAVYAVRADLDDAVPLSTSYQIAIWEGDEDALRALGAVPAKVHPGPLGPVLAWHPDPDEHAERRIIVQV